MFITILMSSKYSRSFCHMQTEHMKLNRFGNYMYTGAWLINQTGLKWLAKKHNMISAD